MRTVIQRVNHASVTINNEVKASIGQGFLVLLGVCEEDNEDDVNWLVRKIVGLRVFDDDAGVMNRSITDTGGDALRQLQERKPPVMAESRPPRSLRSALRNVLQRALRGTGKTRWNRRIRRLYEGSIGERRARHHLHGHEKQGINTY